MPPEWRKKPQKSPLHEGWKKHTVIFDSRFPMRVCAIATSLSDSGSGDHCAQRCSPEVSMEDECFHGNYSFHGNHASGLPGK